MKAYLLNLNIFSILIAVACHGQMMDYDQNKKIQIKLLDEQVNVKNASEFDLRVRVTNKSDTTFLLYGFKDVQVNGLTEKWLKDGDITIGLELITFDKKNKQINLHLDDFDEKYSGKPIPWDSAVNYIHDKSIILPGKGVAEIVIPIKLYNKDMPEKGEYKVNVIYYSGKNIVNIIPEKTIREDEKKSNAIPYQGYTKSNTIKLIVK